MKGDTSTKRRLEYWKSIADPTRPWITFDLVPRRVIPDSFYFDEFVEQVKLAGFNYEIVEVVETVVDDQYGKEQKNEPTEGRVQKDT